MTQNKEKNIQNEKHYEKHYEKPLITTYEEEEILELIGPANTSGSSGFHEPHGHAWGWHRNNG